MKDAILIQMFSKYECEQIIHDIEKHKNKIKISTEHGPESLAVYELAGEDFSSNIREFILKKIEEKLPHKKMGKVCMLFAIKYSPETKNSMPEHYDSTDYTAVVALNDNYEGGGTAFPLYGEIIKPNTGEAILFKADRIMSCHAAYPVTKGVRYVLTIRTQKATLIFSLMRAIFLMFVQLFLNKYKSKFFKELKYTKL